MQSFVALAQPPLHPGPIQASQHYVNGMGIFLALIGSSLAQENRGAIPPPPQIDRQREWRIEAGIEEKDRESGFMEFGEFKRIEFDYSIRNDILANIYTRGNTDTGHTFGTNFGISALGSRGAIRLGYHTELYTKEDPVQGQEKPLTRFLDDTDLNLSYRPRPRDDGWDYELRAKLQSVGDNETWYGGQSWQKAFHKAGLGSTEVVYNPGNYRETSFGLGGNAALTSQTDDGCAYIRGILGAELNTDWSDQSFVCSSIDAGVGIIMNDNRERVLEVRTGIQCKQFFDGNRESWANLEARLNLYVSRGISVYVSCGADYPLEQNEDLYRYTDSNAEGHINLWFQFR